MDHWRYLLALKSIKRVGDYTIRKLVSALGSCEKVFEASREDITSIPGLGVRLWEEIKGFSEWDKIDRQIRYMKENNIRIIESGDPGYPANLRNIYKPPLYLFVQGEILPSDNTSVAIVGSRMCDNYGRKITRKISGSLAEMGITVVSGMAMGIDAVSHLSSMEKGGRTIAVLGNGIDIKYPTENRELYKRIPYQGAVISEFTMGTQPESGNFPKRNRIISGLSLGVVVIQASKNSGSLITASLATEQNREVLAVPGNIDAPLSAGTNMLIKQGARLVESVDDIIEEIGQLGNLAKNRENKVSRIKHQPDDLDEREKQIYTLLEKRPHHVDELAKKLNIDSSGILSMLLDLELRDIVEQTPGKYFRLP